MVLGRGQHELKWQVGWPNKQQSAVGSSRGGGSTIGAVRVEIVRIKECCPKDTRAC